MKLIKQEESSGCTIACIAMVLGKTYWEVRKDFVNDFEKEGQNIDLVKDYLGDQGFSIISKKYSHWNHVSVARKEMLKPFAPIHVLQMSQTFDMPHSHVVVMDAKGKLFDPAGNDAKVLQKAYVFHEVIGLYK